MDEIISTEKMAQSGGGGALESSGKASSIARQCTATNRVGIRCAKSAMLGQQICHIHGGKAPQNLRAARKRMLEMADGAMVALQDALDHGDIKESTNAARIVLDRSGLGPTSTVDLVEKRGDDYSRMSGDELAEKAQQLAVQAVQAKDEERDDV